MKKLLGSGWWIGIDKQKHGLMVCKEPSHKVMFIACMCLYSSTLSAQETERTHSLKGTSCMIDLRLLHFGMLPTAIPWYILMRIKHSPQTHSPHKRVMQLTLASNTIQDAGSNSFKLGSSETVQLVGWTVSFFGWLWSTVCTYIHRFKDWEYYKITNKKR